MTDLLAIGTRKGLWIGRTDIDGGEWVWDDVATRLRALGHEVHALTPGLEGEHLRLELEHPREHPVDERAERGAVTIDETQEQTHPSYEY